MKEQRPKLLVVTPRLPYPVVGGDRLRIYQICKALSVSNDITLVSLCESRQELTIPLPSDGVFERVRRVYLAPWRSRLNALLAVFSNVPLQVAYYRSREMSTVVDDEIRNHDLALAHLVRTEVYIRGKGIPTIVEMTDAISLNYSRSKSIIGLKGLRPIIYHFEQRRLFEMERGMLNKHTLLSMISKVDAKYLFGSPTPSNVVICGNGVSAFEIAESNLTYGTTDIAFIGNMNTLQNMDAVQWFASEVLPILRRHGEFRLRVIGRISLRARQRLECRAGVVVTGEVESVPAAAMGCFAAVCPMRVGAGVQNKVLEYLALGLPTVTSSVGAEGIEVQDGVHLMIADKADRVAQLLIKIHETPQLAKSLSQEGRELIGRAYRWNEVLQPLSNAVSAQVSVR